MAKPTGHFVQHDHEFLTQKPVWKPAKVWDQRQSEIFAVICDWLEGK